MKSNLLMTRIDEIQKDYQELLTSLLPMIQKTRCLNALDEINLFWTKNMDIVRLFLRTNYSEGDRYAFTAITVMDFDDNEHIPFLLMGDQHILDDPLSKNTCLYKNMPEGKYADVLYDNMIKEIEDIIKILKNVQTKIIVLPLRLFNQTSNDIDDLINIGEQVFINMFDGIENVDDYFNKCIVLDDLSQYLRKDVEQAIVFSEDEKNTLSFKQRFESAISGYEYIVDSTKPDSFNFFVIVFGNIQQALDVIASCLEYNCIPFIRSRVVLHYMSMLLENMGDSEIISIIKYKMSIAHIVYMLSDKEQMTKQPLDVFLQRSQEYCFDRKLFNRLSNEGINRKNYLEKRIKHIVLDELDHFYQYLNSESAS